MENSLNLLMQDIIFLIKRSLENSFYCESLDLCQPVYIKISREDLILKFSDEDIKESFEIMYRMFFKEVKCNCKPTKTAILRLIDRISFSETTIYFTTYQFYVNMLYSVNFQLKEIMETEQMDSNIK